MISVDEAARALVAPAQSIEELLDRLSVLIGRVLKVQVARVPSTDYGYGSSAYTAIGELLALIHAEGSDRITVRIGPKNGESVADRQLKLSSEISLLRDGLWVPIHTPEEN